jgi:putative transcriptional regulator
MEAAMKSLQGQLLVASPKLVDPNFFHAVVLLVQHNDEGALGLVLNRPLQTTVQEMWEEVGESDCEIDQPLHQGGPCEGPLMVVHGARSSAEIEVSDGVYFCTSRDRIEALIEQGKASAGGRGIKFFVGYSGWTAGQLEAELREGSWLTINANPKAVFQGDEHLWSDLVRAISQAAVTEMADGKLITDLVDPKLIPDDPSVN